MISAGPDGSSAAPERSSRLLSDDVVYPESPRWHDGKLYFSDVHDYRIKVLDRQGRLSTLAQVPTRPAGLGFLPDGQLLVATAFDRTLSLVEDGGLRPVCDLSAMTSGFLNDMVVDGLGRAYVGATGFNLMAGETPRAGQIVSFTLDAGPVLVSDDVRFPNGIAISEDHTRLVLSETAAQRVSMFDIATDGTLGPRRTFIELGTATDGLCLDRDGGIWVALLTAGQFVHVSGSGQVDDRIDTEGRLAVACVFGGEDRRDLILCSADTTMAELANGVSRGQIHAVNAAAAGAGWP